MKKILSSVIILTYLSGANAETFEDKPMFNTDAMCIGLAKNFAIGYEYSKKDRAPEEFCEGIVSLNIRKTTMPCSIEDIVKGCVKNINESNRESR
jgi:hypothetical protein